MKKKPKKGKTIPEIPNKNNAGRKWFDGKDENEVITKLESVWLMGGTDKEACFYAEVSPQSLCRYLKRHKELRNRKEQLLENPNLRTRQTIYNNLTTPDMAKWFAERKLGDEFNKKDRVEIVAETEVVRLRKDMKSLLKNIKNAGETKNDKAGKRGVPVSAK